MKYFFPRNKRSPDKSLLIKENEILSELTNKSGTGLFLGKYPLNAVLAVFSKKNFFKEAQKRKLWPLKFDLDSTEFPPLQRYRIYYQIKDPKNLVVDLKIREHRFKIDNEIGFELPLPEFNFLTLEWLTLQNPLQEFSKEKTPLPGQKHPGLSLGRKVVDLFIYLARLNGNDGILAFPSYLHNALLFSRYFHFVNPEKKAEIMAIRKTFSNLSFKELAWIVHLDCLRVNGKNNYEWAAEAQIYPMNKLLKKYFNSRQYKDKVKDAQRHNVYTIDWEAYNRKRGSVKY
ncbi:hypothetical protein ACFLQZ_03000 [Acidobacteriota bacterium]